MNWLKIHKSEMLKLTIVSVMSLIIFNILMATFNWIVSNVPVLVEDSGSALSEWWVFYANWGQGVVTVEITKFQIISVVLTLLLVAMHLLFWGFNRKYDRDEI